MVMVVVVAVTSALEVAIKSIMMTMLRMAVVTRMVMVLMIVFAVLPIGASDHWQSCDHRRTWSSRKISQCRT